MIIINEGFWSPKHKTPNWIYLVFNHKPFISVYQLEIYRFQLSVMANGCDVFSAYHVSGCILGTLTKSLLYVMVITIQQGRFYAFICKCQH